LLGLQGAVEVVSKSFLVEGEGTHLQGPLGRKKTKPQVRGGFLPSPRVFFRVFFRMENNPPPPGVITRSIGKILGVTKMPTDFTCPACQAPPGRPCRRPNRKRRRPHGARHDELIRRFLQEVGPWGTTVGPRALERVAGWPPVD